MAKTLTNERSLAGRQDDIARELALFRRMRLLEWGAAGVAVLAGLLWKFAGSGGWGLLIFGAFLAFLALGLFRPGLRTFGGALLVLLVVMILF